MASEGPPDRSWSLGRRLAAEFVVIVAGVLVALAVDAARDARQDHVRATGYLQQLRADLSTTSGALTAAITIDERARDGADRMIQALNSPRLPTAHHRRRGSSHVENDRTSWRHAQLVGTASTGRSAAIPHQWGVAGLRSSLSRCSIRSAFRRQQPLVFLEISSRASRISRG